MVMDEHVCDPTVQPCPCGWRWEYRVENSRGHHYTTATVVDRFRALYGEPQGTRFIREPEQTPNEGENA